MGAAELVLRVSPRTDGVMTIDDWRDGVKECSHGLDVESPKADLTGEILKFDLAGARLISISSSTQLMRRRRPSPGSSFRPMAIINLSGSLRVRQGDRQCELGANTFAFIDASIPHELEHDGDFCNLAVHFPQTAFTSAAYGKAVARRLESADPLNFPFYRCALDLWNGAASLDPLEHGTALGAVISLAQLTTAMSSASKEHDLPVRVLRAMAFIEHHLADPDLCPERVADAQSVSRRYLDMLFGTRGYRLQTWMWERRLQRAAEELKASNGPHGTILQIALKHGFKTSSHFSRAFAKRFGAPPRAFMDNGRYKLDS